MANSVPCYNPTTCPTGGTVSSHIVGSQSEQACQKSAASGKKNRREIPKSPPTDETHGGTKARGPADADPFFLDSATWRSPGSNDGRVAGFDYNPDTKNLVVALRDEPGSDNWRTNSLVYRDVDAGTVAELDEAIRSGRRLDDQFTLLVEDDFEVIAIGAQPSLPVVAEESLLAEYIALTRGEGSNVLSDGDAIRSLAERDNVEPYAVKKIVAAADEKTADNGQSSD